MTFLIMILWSLFGFILLTIGTSIALVLIVAYFSRDDEGIDGRRSPY